MNNKKIRSQDMLLKTKKRFVEIRGVNNKPLYVKEKDKDFITSYLSLKFYKKQNGSLYKHILGDMFTLSAIKRNTIYSLNPYFYNNNNDKIHVINCGNGDCILLESNGEYAMVDFGGRENYIENGNRVYSYLKNNINGKNIKYGIVSHVHEDHIYDIEKISKNYHIDTFKVLKNYNRKYITKKSNLNHIDNIWSKQIEFIDYNQIADQKVEPLTLGSLKIEFLGPTDFYDGVNNNSFVLKVSNRENCILLTGDIEEEAENDFIAFCKSKNIDLSSVNVLKVAHHGSNSSSQDKFLKRLSKNGLTSIISSGDHSMYNHPNNKVLERLKRYGSVFTTFGNGNIVLDVSTKEKLEQSITKYQNFTNYNLLNRNIKINKTLSNLDMVNRAFLINSLSENNKSDNQLAN